MWRDWFVIPPSLRRAIFLVVLAVALAATLLWWPPQRCHVAPFTTHMASSLLSDVPVQHATPAPFDPNSADSLELLAAGLPPRVVRTLLRYRNAGGRFRTVDDLTRIYGLNDTLLAHIAPYIVLPKDGRRHDNSVGSASWRLTDTTVQRTHSTAYARVKYKPGTFVDLNVADTTELMRIPGIGAISAKMIVDYRRKLGGYSWVGQVHEAGDFPESLGDWVHVAVPTVTPLSINRASLPQLRSHPYLTYRQAKSIIAIRNREGPIRSMRQLLFLDGFTEEDTLRLAPYVKF